MKNETCALTTWTIQTNDKVNGKGSIRLADFRSPKGIELERDVRPAPKSTGRGSRLTQPAISVRGAHVGASAPSRIDVLHAVISLGLVAMVFLRFVG